jgi:hypothetical protein
MKTFLQTCRESSYDIGPRVIPAQRLLEKLGLPAITLSDKMLLLHELRKAAELQRKILDAEALGSKINITYEAVGNYLEM